ncbi:hypothetical protein CSC18_4230 [Klebsiella aerogenes]|nr:hypothetical protein CSC18_4230 [Klebsiella aerogenes]
MLPISLKYRRKRYVTGVYEDDIVFFDFCWDPDIKSVTEINLSTSI